MNCRVIPFVPGRRPTDEDRRPGFGSSDCAAFVTGGDGGSDNRAIVLFELSDVPSGARVEATVAIDDGPLAGWDRRPVEVTSDVRQRVELRPDRDFADVELGFAAGFTRRVDVLVSVAHGDSVAYDEAGIVVCDVRNMGSLYTRILDELVAPDTARQATAAGVPDPGTAYHPWYPVLRIGGDKAALYTAALEADIVDKENHLTDPAWLLRVGVYLELLTCLGIVEAVRGDVGDLLSPDERAAFEHGEAFAAIRPLVDPEAWRQVWDLRRIVFPGFGSPRTGAVSALNLLRKKEATLRFLHVHHDDLKHAIALAGPNRFSSQETWQRVFRDAERAVMRQVGAAFPELGFLPGPAREIVLWQRLGFPGFPGQQGLYPTACDQYRASMNSVADWAKTRGLMDHAGAECVPLEASLLNALTRGGARVAALQRQDGLGPEITVTDPFVAPEPTVAEVERLLASVPIFRMVSEEDIHALAVGARPLFLGHTQRFVVEGHVGTSLFLVGDGRVEVRLRDGEGGDRLVETLGPGEVVGEMALLTGEARAATVRSVEETVVYEIGRQLYEPLLRKHPEWLDELAKIMEERLSRRAVALAGSGQEVRSSGLLDRIRASFFG